MPLSEHEQRMLEQIERSLLDEDPKFASAVRASDPQHHAWRRLAWAIVLFVIGVGVMVIGLIAKITPGGVPVLGIAGFVTMFAAAFLAANAFRRTSRPDLRVVGGRSSRSGRGMSHRTDGHGKPHGGSIIDRLEQRWRRRRTGEGL